MARSIKALFVWRGWRDMLAWFVCLVLAVFSVARAIQTGKDWLPAIVLTILVVVFTFVPWLQEAQSARERRALGTLTIDDWGVTRVAGKLREAVAWQDLVWVRIYTSSAGPAVEDVHFALGAADGKGCLVPQDLAVRANLLAILQERLPGLDNSQVIRAMSSTADVYFTIWTRPTEPPAQTPPTTLN